MLIWRAVRSKNQYWDLKNKNKRKMNEILIAQKQAFHWLPTNGFPYNPAISQGI